MRINLDGQALAEMIAILDTEGTDCFSLEGLFEAALSSVEQKKVKLHLTTVHTYRVMYDIQPKYFVEGTREVNVLHH